MKKYKKESMYCVYESDKPISDKDIEEMYCKYHRECQCFNLFVGCWFSINLACLVGSIVMLDLKMFIGSVFFALLLFGVCAIYPK